MDYWAKPGLDRQQAMLFYPTLEQSVSDDHPVRLLDEILRTLDWSAWEQEYDGRRGQPPIPPWVMAGVILYGLMRRIRSSRQLEYACANNIDFMWLVEGRTIDKMQTEEGRATYNRRMHIGETPFAIIKSILDVRRFLLRGLEKVRTEWRWVCTAYNLKKLIAALAVLRAEGVEMAVSLRG
jgi:transposase